MQSTGRSRPSAKAPSSTVRKGHFWIWRDPNSGSSTDQVVKDVVLTITQAMEPVEKGVTKIQKTFHHMSLGSDHKEEVEIDEHLKEDVTESGPNVVSSEKKVMKGRWIQ
ncbi:uncharacterized protein LOC131224022 [Magnolia sinica]|uniref:uncharacterized protein LOC131224022 n=1 Tax=Magnolia sinica TaxID=86752 RepID=UPI002659FFBF|nr:uncharacterized protein LOC131224022 [Magnolia sinica]